LVDEICRLLPGRAQHTALAAPGREPIDYASLKALTEALAADLRRLGIGRGDIVALLAEGGPDFSLVFLAVTEVAACAPLNPAYRPREFASCLSELKPGALIVEEHTQPALVSVAVEMGIPVLLVKRQGRSPATSLVPAAPRTEPTAPATACPAGTALVLHTSATTDRPKRVPLTHDQLIAMVTAVRESVPGSDGGRLLLFSPPFHLQSTLAGLAQFFSGGTVISTPLFRPELFLDWMQTFEPTHYATVPTIHHAIVSLCAANRSRLPFPSLRFVASSGALLTEGLRQEIERTLGVPVADSYGLTESGRVTCTPLDPARRRAGSVGVRCGPQVAVMGPDKVLLPAGSEGEIVLRGPTVMTGYLNDPAANRRAFCDGWFRTGDLGRLDGQGYLFITGRIKEMINRGAEKILPYEIEDVLLRHPAVQEAAVFGFPHPRLGEEVGAAVVLREDAEVTAADLRRMAAACLADFKIPRRIVFVTEIPKGRTGKYQRARLAGQLDVAHHGETDPSAAHGPLDGVEQRLAEIWVELLGLPTIERADDFFALGGDSILAMEMLERLEESFGCRLSSHALAISATLGSLADAVKSARAGTTSSAGDGSAPSRLVALRPGGTERPLFLAGFWENGNLPYREVIGHLPRSRPVYGIEPFGTDAVGPRDLDEMLGPCASDIRSVQPHGPYWLGGYCLHGIFAFELARRLLAMGEPVAGVLLLDAVWVGRVPTTVMIFRRLARDAEFLLRGRFASVASQAAYSAQLWLSRLRAAMSAWGSPGNEPAAKREDLFRNYFSDYRPARLSVDAFLLLGLDSRPRAFALWEKVVRGNLSVCHVPGDHLSILKEPHVKAMAEALRRHMQEVESHEAIGEP